MSEGRIFRQGDVLLVEASLPDQATTELGRDGKGRLVLASGEVTGHHHTVAEPGARLLEFPGRTRYLVVDAPVHLRHEEHLPIGVPAGIFRVVIQREYVPGPRQWQDVGD
jgi:hypothetical protein